MKDLPDPESKSWYIEARVGSANHRGDCVRFIDDRRNLRPEEAGERGTYDNRPVEDVLREALREVARLRAVIES